LLGQLDDGDSQSLEHHLVECAQCQRQLTSLAADDEFVATLRFYSQQAPSETTDFLKQAPEDLVNVLIPHFKQIALDDSTIARTTELDATPGGRVSLGSGKDGLGSNRRAPLAQGMVGIGKYEIRGVLGSGGMGTVLHAFDPMLKRSVAIKVMHTKLLTDPAMSGRFMREAQAAAAVEHDHIVAVHAIEIHDDMPCIVMPLLRGVTLKQRLEATPGPMPLPELLRIGCEAARGLYAAHAAGLVHCDIKPANLWLESPNDRLKILDFGLAIVRDDQRLETEEISGTPGFLAPEQARGLPLDARTDVFSLGCVFYRMATGNAPFTGQRRLKALWTLLSDPPPHATEVNAAVPKELSDLIGRMLARDPDHRPATAAEVAEALEAIQQQIDARQQRTARRRLLVAMLVVVLLTGSGIAWTLVTAPAIGQPVKVTIVGDEPPMSIVIRGQGKEQTMTLGREKVLSLPQGDYTVRPVHAKADRQLVPGQFSVVENRPLTVRIAHVGEITRHATHTQAVTGLAGQADSSETIFSVGLDRVLVAWAPWSTASPRIAELPHAARCVALNADGNLIATAGGNKQPPAELAIRTFRTMDLSPSGDALEGHARMINALAFCPDRKHLASASADGVFLWDLSTGSSQNLFSDVPQFIYAVAFSADGRQLVTGSDEGQVVVWDVASRTSIHTFEAGPSAVRAVGFLGERTVAAGDDGAIRIWIADWNAGSLEQEWLGHETAVLAIAIAPDGRQVVSGAADGDLRVWSVATGQTVQVFHGHRSPVQAVAYVGKGRQAVTGGADGTVCLWQLPFSE
jgi:WD40 repeat protein